MAGALGLGLESGTRKCACRPVPARLGLGLSLGWVLGRGAGDGHRELASALVRGVGVLGEDADDECGMT